jgi:hypothetical protein
LRFDHPDKLDGLIKKRHVAATTLLGAARGFLVRRRVPKLRAAGGNHEFCTELDALGALPAFVLPLLRGRICCLCVLIQ